MTGGATRDTRIAPAPRRPARSSLASRLTAWYAGTAFLLVAGAGWVQYQTLAGDLAAEDDQTLVETLAAAERSGTVAASVGPGDAALGPILRTLDAQCRVVRGGWPAHTPPPACASRLTGDEPGRAGAAGATLRTWRSPDGRTWRVATGTADAAGQRLEVALDRWTDERVLADYRARLTAVLLAALVLATGLGYAFARRGLAPLVALARRMAAIDARSLDQRLAPVPDAPAEVDALVVSFDAMLGRLEGAFSALGQFSAELAHEFRTPLHVMRQQTEVALAQARTPSEYRDVLGSTLEEVDRLRRLVDDMLFLARAEDPRASVARVDLDARRELADVTEYLEPLAAEVGVTLASDGSPGLHLSADRTLFRRALVNLVTNAVRHTPAGGHVALSARSDGDAAIVEVRDTGYGIPSDVLARVFDRHVQVLPPSAPPGSAGEGAGLGLAIVRGIMHLHGGTATAASAPGAGTRITLRFPRPAGPSVARDRG